MKDPNYQWTFCHNDLFPGNVMWDAKRKETVIIDFEMAGVGVGTIDLSAWLIIRSDPAWRRRNEKTIVELYYESLI